MTYPNVRDPDRSVLGKYGGLPIPRTFVISPNWRVTGYIFGEARSEEIDSAIQRGARRMRRLAAARGRLLALVAVPAALASEDHPTSLEVQTELYCDDCQTTLAEASSVSWTPAAIQQIHQMIRQGHKKSQIKQTVARKYYGHLEVLPAKRPRATGRPSPTSRARSCARSATRRSTSRAHPPRARSKAFISARIAAGDSKSQIKDRLVAEYGPADPGRAAEEGLQPAGLATAVRRAVRRRARGRPARVALEPHA